MGDLLQNLLEDVRLARRLFQEDRITEAYFLLQNIERFTQELHPELQSVIDNELNKQNDIATLRMEGLRNANLLALFENGDIWNDWTAGVGTNQDVVVGIHKEEVGGQYYFKVEGRVHCDLVHVLAAVLENELYKFWMPLCTSSKSIAAMSAYRRIVQTKIDFALIQKETLFVGHGDILPDGGVLVTINPTTSEEEAKYLTTAQISALPASDTRLDISGGFLFYEEHEDAAGVSIHAAAAEYEAHNERLLSTRNVGHNPTAKVLRRKTHSAYSKQFSFTGSPHAASFNRNLDLNAVATMSVANDKEYNDRMLTLGRKLATTTKHSTEKQTQAAVTLDRYKLSVQQLYEVKPELGQVPNSSGLANTLNPMKNPTTANISKKADGKASEDDNKKSKKKSNGKKVPEEKKVVLVKGIFKIDPRLTFVPDWIFNMAVRSASAMIIPMLEFQAQQFLPKGLHHAKIGAERSMYAEIQRRLAELHESLDAKEEADNFYAGTSAFPTTPQPGTVNSGKSSGGDGDTNGNGTSRNNNNSTANQAGRFGSSSNAGGAYSPGESYGFGHNNQNNVNNTQQQQYEYEDSNDDEEDESSEEESNRVFSSSFKKHGSSSLQIDTGRAFGSIYS